MPRRLIGPVPFPPVLCFDENREFTLEDLSCIVDERPNGVSICVRYPDGPTDRGGYFFHFVRDCVQNNRFKLYDFDNQLVDVLIDESLVAFINHCTGRRFDDASFQLCQTKLNFAQDIAQDV